MQSGGCQRSHTKRAEVKRDSGAHESYQRGECRDFRCHCASALKYDAIRRFPEDGFLGISPKPPILTPIHAKPV